MTNRIFLISVVVLTIFWAVGLAAFVPTAQAAVSSGDLIRASLPAVYYMGADGKRYTFPNSRCYNTWYSDFSGTKTITDGELQTYPLGGNVTYRPGVKMIKINTDPKVYAVAANGTLRWITTASIAACLYGSNWGTMIDDVNDVFFFNYTVGAEITDCTQYTPSTATALAQSINVDKGLAGATTGNNLNVTLASDTPASQTVAAGSSVNFTKIILSAVLTPVSVKSIYVTRYGISSNNDVANIKFVDISNATISNVASMDSNGKALVTFSPALTVNPSNPLSLYIRASISQTAASSSTVGLGINSANDISLVSGMVGGNFPVIGNYLANGTTGNVSSLTLPEGILIAGRSKQGVASFKITAGTAEDMYVNSVTITDTGTGKVATNWYLYSSQRNDGIAPSEPVATAIMNPITKKAKFVLSTNIVIVLASESVSLTVAVDAALADGDTVKNGDTLQAIVAAGTDIVATGKASGQQINGSAFTDSKVYNLVASYPYISLDPDSPKTILAPGKKTLLAVYQVIADSAKEINFLSAATNTSGIANKLKVIIGHSCTAGIGSGLVLQDENGNILDTQAVDVCAANSATFTFGNPNNLSISAGATKKLYIYADTTGATAAGNSIQVYLSDDNAANLDYAIDGSGNYKYAQYIFKGNIYANVLAK